MAAGYSKRPLVEKLGIKSRMKVAMINAPDNYLRNLGDIPDEIEIIDTIADNCNFIHFFTKD